MNAKCCSSAWEPQTIVFASRDRHATPAVRLDGAAPAATELVGVTSNPAARRSRSTPSNPRSSEAYCWANQASAMLQTRSSKGIRNSDYSFSANCGWIDWGHANPDLREGSDRVGSAGLRHAEKCSSGGLFGGVRHHSLHAGDKSRSDFFGCLDAAYPVTSAIARRGVGGCVEHLQEFVGHLRDTAGVDGLLQRFLVLAGGFAVQPDLFYCVALGVFTGANPAVLRCADCRRFAKGIRVDHDFEKNYDFSPIGAAGPWPPHFKKRTT